MDGLSHATDTADQIGGNAQAINVFHAGADIAGEQSRVPSLGGLTSDPLRRRDTRLRNNVSMNMLHQGTSINYPICVAVV